MSATTITKTTFSSTSTKPYQATSSSHLAQPPRSLRKATSFTHGGGIGSLHAASTPNLNAVYSAHSQTTSRLAAPSQANLLSRKASFAALTQTSLASIPDASETYGLNSVLSGSAESKSKMLPTTPGRVTDDFAVGDTVDVPGNMHGVVRFIGSVQGKKGTFAGVELHPDYAARGKNSGDVDGVSYFSTNVSGAGIFLPLAKASRRNGSPNSSQSIPFTPTASAMGLKMGNQNSTNFTPPTPSLPKFSQSVGPVRAASPQMKRPRPSLPRPESPVRRLMTPGPRPSIAATPASKAPTRYGSPTSKQFAQSVRGYGGDPNKKVSKLERQPSFGPRSASALGQASLFDDDESTPVGAQPSKTTNGSLGSVSSFNSKFRPASRANNNHSNNDEEVERLRTQLEERDRRLRDQSATLAEMESSLTELQTLMENPDALRPRRNSLDDKDSTQLRAILREKNEKIAMLTSEFDAHRADFRSTIDTLEMASTETERVYEKRIEELQQEIRDLESRTDDVDSVARQLKQLEELVQELEEGLEDARRGEAEARGEVEFLRGEVERTRTELRREREKTSTSNGNHQGGGRANDNGGPSSKELEQKEDEIRGLKAIIHSLSRDSIPGAEAVERPHPPRVSSFNNKKHMSSESMDARATREKMEREMSDLRAMLDDKNHREEELERELDVLRRTSLTQNGVPPAQRSSLRDSRDTVILARNRNSRSPEALKRKQALDPMAESDAYSTATENSTLWCEICETAGHDVLTCTEMFGDNAKTNAPQEGLKPIFTTGNHGREDGRPAPLSPAKTRAKSPLATPTVQILPNPLESGPVAGKDSGMVDNSKWCALCERDGHDSVDCPFEDAF